MLPGSREHFEAVVEAAAKINPRSDMVSMFAEDGRPVYRGEIYIPKFVKETDNDIGD